MYERIRAQLQTRLDAQRVILVQRQDAHRAAVAAKAAAAAEVASAQTAVNAAQQLRNAADGPVATAQAKLNDAQAAHVAALEALEAHIATEPIDEDRGHPSPRWRAWNIELAKRRRAVSDAAVPMRNAQSELAAAQAQRDIAASNLVTAQLRLNRMHAELAAAEAVVTAAAAAVGAAQATLAATSAERAALEAREQRILADPLNADDVNDAADAELAVAQASRRTRRALRQHRFEVSNDRAFTLGSHDDTVDDIAVLAVAIRGWPYPTDYPDLAGVATGLDALVTTARVQRSMPAAQRTDDLHAAAARLRELRARLQAVLATAAADRERQVAALRQAARNLADHNRVAPPR